MKKRLQECIDRYPVLQCVGPEMERAFEMMRSTFASGGKLLMAGNGGSSADCDHLAGEFLKGFRSRRPVSEEMRARLIARLGEKGRDMADKLQLGLPALHLGQATALASAWANDVDAELLYAQMLLALGRPGDLLLGISTGGGAKNILAAFELAPELKIGTVLLTGNKNGVCCRAADVVIAVPESETFKIQELHLPIYHALALALEEEFFG